MAIKFDFNKLRTAVSGWMTGVDYSTGDALAIGTGPEQALYIPKIQTAAVTKVVSADVTLKANDFGKIILMGANGVDITLPSAQDGATLEVILTADYDTAVCTVVQAAASEDFYGYQIRGAANSTLLDIPGTASTLTVDANVGQDVEGLRWSVLCDGANWHISGYNTTAIGTANVTLATGV